ncbi:hypothetical protein [Sinorhizobium meliloti]|uniref:hypothetical protein n=1 Tax=Rhizobium meliloti TaxID=382 RepID=UPI0014307FEE|nr:hypothetical protein [Sinorhizobium meliloti]
MKAAKIAERKPPPSDLLTPAWPEGRPRSRAASQGETGGQEDREAFGLVPIWAAPHPAAATFSPF